MAIQFEIEALTDGHHFNPEFPKLLDFHSKKKTKKKLCPQSSLSKSCKGHHRRARGNKICKNLIVNQQAYKKIKSCKKHRLFSVCV